MAGRRGLVGYTASKAAVAALTVALSEEVAKQGILVNAVAPSIMDTPANRAAIPKADYGPRPKVEEVATTIVFLGSRSCLRQYDLQSAVTKRQGLCRRLRRS